MEIAENWKKIVVIAIIAFSAILILIGLFLGLDGLAAFFKFIIIGLLVLSLLVGAGYIVYILFIKKSWKDIPAQYRKKLLATTKIMENDMLGDLYLSGDTKHNRIKLGKFFYLRIRLPKIYNVEVENQNDPNRKPEIQTFTEDMPIEVFIIKRKGWLNKMFLEPIVVLCRPEDHDYSAIFNDVTLNSFNLVPLDSQFYTIDRRNLDVDVIKGMAMNYVRETVFEVLRDLEKLVKSSIALDQSFQKDKEKAREFEIPQIPGIGGQK